MLELTFLKKCAYQLFEFCFGQISNKLLKKENCYDFQNIKMIMNKNKNIIYLLTNLLM